MKKYLFILAIILATQIANAGLFDGTQGAGTEISPYLIYSKADIEELADSVALGNFWSSGKYFELMNDITDSVRKCIGHFNNTHTYQFAFSGNFDGKGYKITLSIYNDISNENVGCFGMAFGANIRNLVVDGKVVAAHICGGIVGVATTGVFISNCVNFCEVVGSHTQGGIVGRITESVLEHCINLGVINGGSTQTGGITGDGQSVTQIRYNLNLGVIYSSAARVGAMCGDNTNDNISNCINAGFIPRGNSMFGDNSVVRLSNSINIGVTERSIVSSSCRYDIQMCLTSSPQGLLTDNMLDTSLRSLLDTHYWYFADSLYPQLKNMPLLEANYVAASPVFFV